MRKRSSDWKPDRCARALARYAARPRHCSRARAFALRPTVRARLDTQNRTWFAAGQVEKRMMFIILMLIIAVAAFNLVSSLVMTVTSKQADIAILRTLGARPASIMQIFFV